MRECVWCDDNGMYNDKESAIPCNYCLTGKLQAENTAKDKEIVRLKKALEGVLPRNYDKK